MSTKTRLALLLCAVIGAGCAWADTPLGGPLPGPGTPPADPTPPPAAPETPPAAPAAPGAMMTSVNATTLKAMFDEAGVPVEVKTTAKGYSYLVGKPQDFIMVVYPSNCEGDSLTGKCALVALESGTWTKQVTADQVNKFNQDTRLADAVVYDDAKGQPVIEYGFAIAPGVDPTYVRSILRNFVGDMQGFHDYLQTIGGSAAAAPKSGGGVFAAGKGGASAVGKPTTFRMNEGPIHVPTICVGSNCRQ